MNKEQYGRASQQSFVTINVIFAAVLLITLEGAIVGHSINGKIIAEISGLVIGAVISYYGFLFHRYEHLGASLLMAGASVTYAVVIIAENDTSFVILALPILIAAVIYLNRRLIWSGSAIIIVSFLIVFSKTIIAGNIVRDDVVFLIMTAVAIFSALKVSSLLRTFINENNDTISANLNQSRVVNDNLKKSAGNIMEQFREAEKSLGDLKEIINSNEEGMSQIAKSTESTAEAIQDQAVRSQEIQNQANSTEEARKEMVTASQEAQQTIQVGQQAIDDLKQSTKAVQDASAETVKATQAVTDKVGEVKNIVGEIIGISNQTNLLALNASIEAARAGEAGKGFAVVADEIRNLSEQTSTASKKITDIIEELTSDADTARNNTDHTAETVDKQNEIIGSVNDNFESIDQNVTALLSHFENIGSGIQAILSSTSEINESISQLSASSEEVASLSNEGAEDSKSAVAKFNEVNAALQKLSEEAAQLRKSATNEGLKE